MNSKAQATGSGAAGLIALIALFIVIYLVMLPPDVRDAALGENSSFSPGSSSSSGSGGNRRGDVLLSDTPKRLDTLGQTKYLHEVPSFTLYSTTGADTLARVDSLYVKNSMFDVQDRDISFTLQKPESTTDLKLGFKVLSRKGRLKISLNDNVIFDKDVSTSNIDPISLPASMLQKDNKLVFSVSPVGFEFWRSNEYAIENIVITGTVKDISGQSARQIFTLSTTEMYNIKEAELRFFVDCKDTERTGRVTVALNGDTVYSAVPDCGNPVRPIEVTTYVKAGENVLQFMAEDGTYLLDQIKVNTNLKDIPVPVYYFDLTPDEYRRIADNDYSVNLTLDFADDYEYKEAKILVNGHATYVAQRENDYSKDISAFTQEDSNWIKIIPQDTLDVSLIEVRLHR